ncbi:uncharacterized protein LOC144921492 [Branchiostoma floridae x Branchiostoma belcheri]
MCHAKIVERFPRLSASDCSAELVSTFPCVRQRSGAHGNTMDSFATRCIFVVLTLQHLPAGEGTTLSCDFETSDLCGYTQDTTDDQDWTRHTGHTPTANTGPSVDHTMGTGHYMYLETSVGNPGDAARLVSPSFPASSAPYCLRFYYHMFGDSTGILNLYTRKQGIMGAAVWTVSGNQGNVWNLGNAQLDGSGGFNVVFEAVRGDGFRGDIAIDDVTISQDCTPIPTTVLPTTTPYPLASPNCTFEVSSICGYRQDIHDSAEWTRHQGQTDSDNTGPGVDHTLGTVQGHYMYFEASSIDPGVTARLLSPTLPIIPSSSSPTSYCLTFWYHMYGPHIGILNVNRRDSGGSEIPLWRLFDDQGNTWQQGQLPLDGNTESTVVFEAVRGSSYRGDIAIDDVDVIPYSGQCEFIPAFAMVPSSSTPAITTQSPSTSVHISTPGALPMVTTAKQPTTETPPTTGRIPPAATVVQPTATTTHSAQLPSTRAFLSTPGKLPIETTTERKATSMSTGTSSTNNRIRSDTTHVPPTTVIIHAAQSNGAKAGGNISAGQVTGENSASTTVALGVALPLTLIFGATVGIASTVYYRKKKRSRSGHGKVKRVSGENNPVFDGNSCPGTVNNSGGVDFDNPTFDHIYEELPNVLVVNSSPPPKQQKPKSDMPSASNEDYVEINENEVSWAKASSQRHVSATKNAGHISSPPKDRNTKEEHTSEVYRRDSWGAESDYLPPISDTNVPGPNMGRLKSNAEDTDEEYEDVGGEEYLDLNPRPPAHHPSLRPDHHPSLRPDHHPSLRPDHHPSLQPETYQSLKPDHDQYQRLRSDQRQSLPSDDHRRLRQSQKQNPDIPEHVDSPDGYQSLRHSQYQKLNVPPGTKDAFRP